MYSMMRNEPPLEPSSVAKTSGTTMRPDAARRACRPRPSPKNMVSSFLDPEALTTSSQRAPSTE